MPIVYLSSSEYQAHLVVVVVAVVRVGCGGHRAAARLGMRTALTYQSLMLA